MLKIIGVIFSIVITFAFINGIIIHNNAASMPFGAFLMDIFFLLLVIFYFVIVFFKEFKKGMKFKEVVKENYISLGYFSGVAACMISDIIHYLLR